MESILEILGNPAAWVSNIIFGVVSTAIWKCFPLAKTAAVRQFRSSRLKRLRKLRLQRENLAAISYAISKATAMQTTFTILCFFYVLAVLIWKPYTEIIRWSVLAGIVLATPVFIFEMFWLSYDAFARSLVKESGKMARARRRRRLARQGE